MIKISELKTDKDGFNNLPARAEIEKELEALPIEFVDLIEQKYWQNENDTIVLRIKTDESKGGSFNLARGLIIGEFANRYNADELDFIEVDDKIIVRLWWD